MKKLIAIIIFVSCVFSYRLHVSAVDGTDLISGYVLKDFGPGVIGDLVLGGSGRVVLHYTETLGWNDDQLSMVIGTAHIYTNRFDAKPYKICRMNMMVLTLDLGRMYSLDIYEKPKGESEDHVALRFVSVGVFK